MSTKQINISATHADPDIPETNNGTFQIQGRIGLFIQLRMEGVYNK